MVVESGPPVGGCASDRASRRPSADDVESGEHTGPAGRRWKRRVSVPVSRSYASRAPSSATTNAVVPSGHHDALRDLGALEAMGVEEPRSLVNVDNSADLVRGVSANRTPRRRAAPPCPAGWTASTRRGRPTPRFGAGARRHATSAACSPRDAARTQRLGDERRRSSAAATPTRSRRGVSAADVPPRPAVAGVRPASTNWRSTADTDRPSTSIASIAPPAGRRDTARRRHGRLHPTPRQPRARCWSWVSQRRSSSIHPARRPRASSASWATSTVGSRVTDRDR